MADCSQYTPRGGDINTSHKFGLTERQRDALSFMREFHRVHQVFPSYQEMMEGLGLSSKSSVYRLILSLEQRGYIKRIPSCARAIKLIEHDAVPGLNTAIELVLFAAARDQALRAEILEALG